MPIKSILFTAAAAVAIAATPAQAQIYGFQLSDSSEPLSAGELASFLGAPDDDYTGIGAGYITYDFGNYRLIDGAGQDLNVYEVDNGVVEFGSVDILVSADSINWFNIEGSAAAALNLIGDEAHGSAAFRFSYDLGGAVATLGVSQFRYLRLDGTGSGAIGGSNGFDPDSVAAINYIDLQTPAGVPEPAVWGMLIGGFGFAGAALRRRSVRFAAA